jgi:hypothetical protein
MPSATLAEAAQFEDSASTASTLSPVPDDPEFDKDSDIQTVLPGHDNQANTTTHAATLSGAIRPRDSTSIASTPNPLPDPEIDKDPETLNRVKT